jgi:3-deoxy-D-arabino-heptulosonate 7-phosphate (DAHP) synthase
MNMPLKTELTQQDSQGTPAHRVETRLPTPAELRRQMPTTDALAAQVAEHRQAIRAILRGDDPRLLIVMGPCSIHDEVAALEYAEKLKVHREMVSGLPMPTGFKNGTDGGIAVATNAMKSAAHPHHHMGVSATGAPVMITTRGNPDTHLVLRGGRGITNYDAGSIELAVASLRKACLSTAVMVDCSHDNARKQAERQLDIARDVMAQRLAGNHHIRGLMLESFLEPGRQDDGEELRYGCSITDPCLGWAQTEALIRSL